MTTHYGYFSGGQSKLMGVIFKQLVLFNKYGHFVGTEQKKLCHFEDMAQVIISWMVEV